MCHTLFIPSCLNGHLDCFPFLALMNNASINIHIQVFVWTYAFISLECVPKSRITGPCGNFVFNHSKTDRLFPKLMHHLTSAVYESSSFSTSSLTLVIRYVFD